MLKAYDCIHWNETECCKYWRYPLVVCFFEWPGCFRLCFMATNVWQYRTGKSRGSRGVHHWKPHPSGVYLCPVSGRQLLAAPAQPYRKVSWWIPWWDEHSPLKCLLTCVLLLCGPKHGKTRRLPWPVEYTVFLDAPAACVLLWRNYHRSELSLGSVIFMLFFSPSVSLFSL